MPRPTLLAALLALASLPASGSSWTSCLDPALEPPAPLEREAPAYPESARLANAEGSVEVAFTVLATGGVGWVRIVRAEPSGFFEQATLEGVRGWRFTPATRDGAPVECRVKTRLKFTLADVATVQAGAAPAGGLAAPAYPPAAREARHIRPAQFSLAVRPDLRAAAWISEHLPKEARFLTNSIFAYDGYAIVGTDGGWWLPLLAGRPITTPPLNYTSESHPRSDFLAWTNALPALIQEKGIAAPETLQELAKRGISHIYIGQQNGMVNASEPLLKLDEILSSPQYEPVYHQDRVWIFKINPAE